MYDFPILVRIFLRFPVVFTHFYDDEKHIVTNI